MKEKNLKIIIALMSAAVVGLIAIQIYWIVSLLNTEERKFISEVSDALEVVVENIERKEAADYTIQNIFRNEEVIIKIDGEESRSPLNFIIRDSSGIRGDTSDNLDFDLSVNFSGSEENKAEIKTWVIKKDGISLASVDNERFTVRKKMDSVILRKSELVEDVVNQLIVAGIDTSSINFNTIIIDSLLGDQLNQRGITADYYFGIRKSSPDSFLFVQSEASKPLLLKSNFNVRLFSEKIFSEPSYLTVYFPDQKSYILRSNSIMLSLSAVLILIIAGVFYKTVQLLIKQKKLTEIKNDLINNITHEFKTPISTISLACEALEEPKLFSESSSVKKYTRMIREENRRLALMVETILNNAALERGDYKLSIENINANELIEELIDKYKKSVEERGGRIISNLRAEKHTLDTDKFHLTNILNNLIDNAVKYTVDDPEIILSSRNEENSLVISVEDNGVGISRKDQKRIFDTFFRVHKGNIHDVKGYGIGLSYVKKMMSELGGSIEVKSKLNSGSKFELKFPLKLHEN